MNLIDFQKQVTRTIPDLGSPLLNAIHCVLGLAGELTEEVTIALRKKDNINLGEEFGDTQWYIGNLATIYYIQLPDHMIIPNPLELSGEERDKWYDGLLIHTGRLLDLVKRELAYKKVANPEDIKNALLSLMLSIEFVAADNNINMNEYRAKNIQKLLKRYPIEEGFSNERAINRNTDEERKVLAA